MQAPKTIIHMLAVASGFALAHTPQPAFGQCQIGDRTWTLVAQSGPSSRSVHAMVYDSARSVVVLFGGQNESGRFKDTWEWNGVTWTFVTASGPSPRTGHAMAYDSARDVTVLFGGHTGSTALDDTWEWNGSTWTQRKPATHPLHRNLHAMVYDSESDRTVLFGGFVGGNEISRETWGWNGTNWSLLANTGPGRRHEHAMAYDSQRDQTVFFGGRTFSVFDDTWEWSGGWTQHDVVGPSARSRHAMAYASACAVSVLFGGQGANNSVISDQTWEWDGLAWSQQFPGVRPSARKDHAMAYDSDRNVVVLFGGFVAGTDGEGGNNWETWEYECVPDMPDCNGNGIWDDCDVNPTDPDGNGQVSLDCNEDGVPDECVCPADFDCDGTVGASDLAQLLGRWGLCDDCNDCPADFTGDCRVLAADLAVLLDAWGPCS